MKKYLASLLTLLSPAIASAEEFIPIIQTVNDSKGVLKAVSSITDWIFSGFLMFAVVMILWAAFNFLMAQGDSEKFSQAKKSVLYAAIAIAIAVLSKSIVMIAANIAGGNVNYN